MCASKQIVIFILLVTSSFCPVSAKENILWPVGMSFVALTENGWQLYIVKPDSSVPKSVALNSEPRTPAYSPSLGLITYISSLGDVLQYDLSTGKEKILLKKRANIAYTQPVYSPERYSLIVVELQQARSKQTRIIEINLQTGGITILSHQRSAQFEPAVFGQNLYYTNVHCIENCAGRYVHEIWSKNLLSDDAQQLTLLNTLTHQSAISPNGKHLYVSSEKAGGKRIWKCVLDNSPPIPCTKITSKGIADTSPALGKDGALYFMHLQADGSKLILKAGDEDKDNNEPEVLPLPEKITEIRDMKIGQ
jgi:Tol biopolymer transport system component